MRTKTDTVLDIVAGAIIGLAIFVLIYTATHLYQLAAAAAVEPTLTPNHYPTKAADWAVVSCDHTKSVRHRAPCGLVRNNQDVEMN